MIRHQCLTTEMNSCFQEMKTELKMSKGFRAGKVKYVHCVFYFHSCVVHWLCGEVLDTWKEINYGCKSHKEKFIDSFCCT